MLTTRPATWTVRGATFALAALAGLSAVYWALKLGGGAPSVQAPVAGGRGAVTADAAAVARLLGGGGPLPAAAAPMAVATLASRLQLVGVVAGATSGGGAAVISVDGKPAKPYRVGSQVEEGVVLQSVRGRQAVIAPANGTPVTLELPLARNTPQAATAAPR